MRINPGGKRTTGDGGGDDGGDGGDDNGGGAPADASAVPPAGPRPLRSSLLATFTQRSSPVERLSALIGALFAAGGFIVVRGVQAPGGHPQVKYLALGLAMAAFLAVAGTVGGRYLAGMAAIAVASGPWGKEVELGWPFLGLAIWYLLKASREARRQADIDRAAREAAGGSRPTRPTRPSRARPGRAGPGRRGSERTGSASRRVPAGEVQVVGGGAKPRPGASKRYTPPKPGR